MPSSTLIFDADLEVKADGAVTSSTNHSILDLGPGLFEGELVIDVSAIETGTGDETYDLTLDGSNDSGHASGVSQLCTKFLGNAQGNMDQATGTGRFVVPFKNEENGTIFRYVRLASVVAGTITTGITFHAWIAKH